MIIYMYSYHEKYLKYKAKYLNLKKLSSNNISNNISNNTSNNSSNNIFNNNFIGGGEKTQVYLFKAEWCGHCRGFKPIWEKIKKEYNDKYEFITVDSEKDKNKIDEWKITGFPTIIKKNNNSAEEYVGPRDEESVVTFIKKN